MSTRELEPPFFGAEHFFFLFHIQIIDTLPLTSEAQELKMRAYRIVISRTEQMVRAKFAQ